MRKLVFILILFFYAINYSFGENSNVSTSFALSESRHLYNEMQLKNINFKAFEKMLEGYNKLDIKNKDVVTLIDFSKPSTEERMYVIDMNKKKLLFSTHVSHGKNSGDNYASHFSNEAGSHKSSLGFFLTANTYFGKHGYSLILEGLEKGINDCAKERAIVIHSAAYADPSVIVSAGRLGRSFGCPALPKSVSKPIIDTIKNGTLLFIYANDESYFDMSDVL